MHTARILQICGRDRGDIFPTLIPVSIEIAAAATYGWDERENDNVA